MQALPHTVVFSSEQPIPRLTPHNDMDTIFSNVFRTKDDFRDRVAENPTNHNLWSLNFLRDAFKAEIALQRDALYLTHDRLAYLYYRMLGGRKGALLGLEPAVQRDATVETVRYALTI
jgi:hypothetical protein